MKEKDENSKQLEVLFFDYFLKISINRLKAWIQLYNLDLICQEARFALEAIEKMSG